MRKRKVSEFDYYHITIRGVGQMRIFEGDKDYSVFLKRLKFCADRTDVSIQGYCLMSNHCHILIKGELRSIAKTMQDTCSQYARYFNKLYDRVGHLFQSRFNSVAIQSEQQLLTTLKYIHFNPLGIGVSSIEKYKWSSASEYLGKCSNCICETTTIIAILGGKKGFKSLHSKHSHKAGIVTEAQFGQCISDFEGANLIRERYGRNYVDTLSTVSIQDRDRALRELYKSGLSRIQLVRLTGFGHGIIYRACKGAHREANIKYSCDCRDIVTHNASLHPFKNEKPPGNHNNPFAFLTNSYAVDSKVQPLAEFAGSCIAGQDTEDMDAEPKRIKTLVKTRKRGKFKKGISILFTEH